MQAIGADQFFPIFLYVVIQAGGGRLAGGGTLPSPFQCCAYMQRFAPDVYRNSEMGYYLTSFEAAITNITDGGRDGCLMAEEDEVAVTAGAAGAAGGEPAPAGPGADAGAADDDS
eukprot:SAG22_NODE_3030_length_2013_cov_2.535005_1_plen_115_part_00